jgi:hypothetical protein
MANPKSQRKEKGTVAVPQRIMNKVAISMIPMKKVDRKGFYGYEGSIKVNGGTMTVRGTANITAQDMRMFHFVLSQWQAMRTTTKDDILFVDLTKIIGELGWTNRTENRRRIVTHLENMTNTAIKLDYDGRSIMFSTLDFVKVENSNTVSLRVSKTFEESMGVGAKRFINVEATMKATSGYVIELANLLQLDGSGVENGSGAPAPCSSINHDRVCDYLVLERGARESLEEVRRAFKLLEAHKFPHYKKHTIQGNIIWMQSGKNISIKALDYQPIKYT